MTDYSALWGPLGTVVVLLLGWLLQQWTKRVERKNQERQAERERKDTERKEREAWEATRVDVAKDVSQAWNPVFEGMGREMKRLNEKCDNCESTVNLLRRDFGAFTDIMVEVVASLPAGELKRKGEVAISAARLSHLTHNN